MAQSPADKWHYLLGGADDRRLRSNPSPSEEHLQINMNPTGATLLIEQKRTTNSAHKYSGKSATSNRGPNINLAEQVYAKKFCIAHLLKREIKSEVPFMTLQAVAAPLHDHH